MRFHGADDPMGTRDPMATGGEDIADIDIEHPVHCPYCGESGTVLVDPVGGGHQQYVQDCEVCCRPWEVTVRVMSHGMVAVEVKQEDA